MLAIERLLEIEQLCTDLAERIHILDLDGETLRLVLFLRDGSNLRIAEQWRGDELKRYSYYWLTADNQLQIGWDNAPHHQRLSTHPHHRHVGGKDTIQPSHEHRLEDVLDYLRSH